MTEERPTPERFNQIKLLDDSITVVLNVVAQDAAKHGEQPNTDAVILVLAQQLGKQIAKAPTRHGRRTVLARVTQLIRDTARGSS